MERKDEKEEKPPASKRIRLLEAPTSTPDETRLSPEWERVYFQLWVTLPFFSKDLVTLICRYVQLPWHGSLAPCVMRQVRSATNKIYNDTTEWNNYGLYSREIIRRDDNKVNWRIRTLSYWDSYGVSLGVLWREHRDHLAWLEQQQVKYASDLRGETDKRRIQFQNWRLKLAWDSFDFTLSEQ